VVERTEATRLNPVHPGEILETDFMAPFGLTVAGLARAIGVNPIRLNDIVRGRRALTAETALRLARYFGTDADSWLNLQNRYELTVAEQEAGPDIRQIRPMTHVPNCFADLSAQGQQKTARDERPAVARRSSRAAESA
jgi:addiction module HigA family antidote